MLHVWNIELHLGHFWGLGKYYSMEHLGHIDPYPHNHILPSGPMLDSDVKARQLQDGVPSLQLHTNPGTLANLGYPEKKKKVH